MPTVPVSPVPQVESSPLRAPRVAPDEVGGIPAVPDLGPMAEQVRSIYEEEKRKTDQVAVTGAAAQVSDLETRLATGARQQLGKNAFTAPDEVAKGWQDGIAEISKGLSNDDQRLAFANVERAHWGALNSTVQSHVAQQRKVYDDETTQSYLGAEANAAVQNYTDPTRVGESIANQQAAIRDHGRRNGLPDEWVDAHTAEVASKTNTAVIERMLANGQDLGARQYYDHVKGTLDGDDATRLDRAIETGTSRAEGRRQAQRIMQTADSREDALVEVDKIDDPRVAAEAQQQVENLWNQKVKNDREQYSANVQRATDIIRQTGDVSHVPPSMWIGMKAGDQEQLERFSRTMTEPGKITTDLPTWLTLRNGLADPVTRDATVKDLQTNYAKYLNKLGPDDFKATYELVQKIVAGDDKVNDQLDDTTQTHGIMSNTLKEIGLTVDPKTGVAEKPEAAVAYRELDGAVEQFQETNKRKATSKEKQELADEIVAKRVIAQPGTFYGTNQTSKRTYELSPQDKLVVKFSDISGPNRVAIRNRLHGQGLPATMDAILDAYKQSIMGLVRRGPQ